MIENGMVKLLVVPTGKATVTRTSPSSTWGWLPLLSLTSAFGVFLVALAYNGGRTSAQWSDLLFWLGWVTIFLPITLRLFSAKSRRRERVSLLVVLAIALYFARFLRSPLDFTLYDEFLHWRATYDITVSKHLFIANPLLPVGPLYPGMEIATNALSSLTGLSIFASGVVLIGVTRPLIVLTLYLLFECFIPSEQVVGLVTLLYMANPNFTFFDVMFAYESLALPLAVFVLFVVARRTSASGGQRMGLNLVVWLGLGAVVITHHLTSFVLVAFLFLWTLLWILTSFGKRRNWKDRVGPGDAALLGLALCLIWLVYTGGDTIMVNYLTEPLQGALPQIVQIISGQKAPRTFFRNAALVAPLWESLTAFASEGLIFLGLPFGLYVIWQRYRTNPLALALAIGALMFPVIQVLRVTEMGAESAIRSTAFLFFGVAFVLALAAMKSWLSRKHNWWWAVLIRSVVLIIFWGQTILGSGLPWNRLPGPYLIAADHRSVEPEGISAAEWARFYLGPGHRLSADRTNTFLMATYGDEWVVTGPNALEVWPIFTTPQFQPQLETIIRQGALQYLVVDHRLSTALPTIGIYIDPEEANAYHHTMPVDSAALTKFASLRNVSRVFDSGNIAVYDVEAITDGSPPPLCVPGPPMIGPSPSLQMAPFYVGTIDNVASHDMAEMFLSDIQQQRGSICGFFTGVDGTVPFWGNIAYDGHVEFYALNKSKNVLFTFDGLLQPDGKLAGSYCRPLVGPCSSLQGVLNFSPLP